MKDTQGLVLVAVITIVFIFSLEAFISSTLSRVMIDFALKDFAAARCSASPERNLDLLSSTKSPAE